MTFSLSLPSQLPSFSYIHPSRRLRRVSLHFCHFIPSFQCNTQTPINPSHMYIQITQEIIVWKKKWFQFYLNVKGFQVHPVIVSQTPIREGPGSAEAWRGKRPSTELSRQRQKLGSKKGVQSAEISDLCRNSALCCEYKAELKLWAWPGAPRGQQTLSSHMTKASVRPGENSKVQIHQ